KQRAGGGRIGAEGGMRHDQRAPLDVVDGHLADRAVQERLDLAPVPDERHVGRLRLDRGDALVAVPERMEVPGFQLGDEGIGLPCHCSVYHCYLRIGGALPLPASGERCQAHVFGNFKSMFVPSMMMCLMNTRGSTFSPLRYVASTSTPSLPHSTELSSTVIARFSSFTARRAGGTPFIPVTRVLPLRFAALTACMAPSATSSLAV